MLDQQVGCDLESGDDTPCANVGVGYEVNPATADMPRTRRVVAITSVFLLNSGEMALFFVFVLVLCEE